jgi:hypothetical protein
MLRRGKNSRHEVINESVRVLSGRLDSLGNRLSDHLDRHRVWPARVARRKGHSFILYFIFGLIFPARAPHRPTSYAIAQRARTNTCVPHRLREPLITFEPSFRQFAGLRMLLRWLPL